MCISNVPNCFRNHVSTPRVRLVRRQSATHAIIADLTFLSSPVIRPVDNINAYSKLSTVPVIQSFPLAKRYDFVLTSRGSSKTTQQRNAIAYVNTKRYLLATVNTTNLHLRSLEGLFQRESRQEQRNVGRHNRPLMRQTDQLGVQHRPRISLALTPHKLPPLVQPLLWH